MRIAHVQPTTLADYPERIAAVVYVVGCNFRCPFCHNRELVLPEELGTKTVPNDDVLSFLDERKKYLDGIVITGGEPTIQTELALFIKQVRQIGLSVKLDTNGSMPDVIDSLLSHGQVDYVAMDIKAPPDRYSELAGVSVDIDAITRSVEVISNNACSHEFRTTVAPTLVEEDILNMIPLIKGATKYYLQQFVVPEGKSLIDPAYEKMDALSETQLSCLWGKISDYFLDGGIR